MIVARIPPKASAWPISITNIGEQQMGGVSRT